MEQEIQVLEEEKDTKQKEVEQLQEELKQLNKWTNGTAKKAHIARVSKEVSDIFEQLQRKRVLLERKMEQASILEKLHTNHLKLIDLYERSRALGL